MENNFDKYFKDKLENRKFEMKPEYWADAEALIEAQERGRDWRRFLWWFAGVLLLGVVVFSVWKKTGGEATSIALENENQNIEHTVIEDKNNQIGINTNEINASSKNENIKENENVESSFSNNLNQTSTDKNNKDENVNELLQESNSKSNSNELNNSNSSIPLNSNSSNTFLEKNNKTFTNDENRGSLVFPNIENPLDNQKEKNENPILTNEKENEEEVQRENLKPLFPIASLVSFLEGREKEEILDLKIEPCFVFPKVKKWMFGLTAGVVGYPLVENSSTQPFIGAKGGLVVERNFTDKKGNLKWTIGSELLYHFRSGNFIVSQQNENLRYSFGRTTSVNQLTPRNLHYLELPVYFKYHLKKVKFEVGGSINYLMGVRGEVTQDATSEKGWMTDAGFKKYHANILLGIHYNMSKNIRFGLRANYTPNGILEDNVSSEKLLRESGPLYLTFKVTQFLNR